MLSFVSLTLSLRILLRSVFFILILLWMSNFLNIIGLSDTIAL